MKRFIYHTTVILICVLLGFNTKVNAQNTLYDLLEASSEHSILKKIVDVTEYNAMLRNNPGPFTLIAPNNNAFEVLAFFLDIDTADLYTHPELVNILTYHLVTGNHDFSQDDDGALVETLGSLNTIKVTNNEHIYLNNAEIDATPNSASNGSLYPTNRVLLPFRTVIDEILAKQHTHFYDLIVASEDLLSHLSNPFFRGTVLSVSNANISKLLNHFDVDLNDVLQNPIESYAVLTMHVINDDMPLNRLDNGDVFEAMNDEVRLKITVNNSDVYFNYAKVLANQTVEPFNGIVHEVDELLIPEPMVMDVMLDEGLILFAIVLVEKHLMPEFCSPYNMKTVLAPANSGIVELFEKLNLNSIPDFLALPNSDEVIKYHWIENERIIFNEEQENTKYIAANGKELIFRKENDSTFINDAYIFDNFPFHTGNGTLYPLLNAIEEFDEDEINVNKIKAIPVKAYPNPTTDFLKFEGISYGTYEILDIQGRTIAKGDFNNGMVDVRTIANGGYFISLQQDNQFYAGAFVKK